MKQDFKWPITFPVQICNILPIFHKKKTKRLAIANDRVQVASMLSLLNTIVRKLRLLRSPASLILLQSAVEKLPGLCATALLIRKEEQEQDSLSQACRATPVSEAGPGFYSWQDIFLFHTELCVQEGWKSRLCRFFSLLGNVAKCPKPSALLVLLWLMFKDCG